MDFTIELPRTRDGYDSIWVIVDKLTKVSHFYTSQDHLFQSQVGRIVHGKDCVFTWCFDKGLYRVEELSLPHVFGRNYMNQWVSNLTLALLIIHKHMAKQKEWLRFLMICLGPVLWNMVEVRTRVCLTQNSVIITVIGLVS